MDYLPLELYEILVQLVSFETALLWRTTNKLFYQRITSFLKSILEFFHEHQHATEVNLLEKACHQRNQSVIDILMRRKASLSCSALIYLTNDLTIISKYHSIIKINSYVHILGIAANRGYINTIFWLLGNCKCLHSTYVITDCMHHAAAGDQIEILKYLATFIWNLNNVSLGTIHYENCMAMAFKHGQLGMIYWLERHYHITIESEYIIIAAVGGQLGVIQEVCTHFNIQISFDQLTMLYDQHDVLTWFLEYQKWEQPQLLSCARMITLFGSNYKAYKKLSSMLGDDPEFIEICSNHYYSMLLMAITYNDLELWYNYANFAKNCPWTNNEPTNLFNIAIKYQHWSMAVLVAHEVRWPKTLEKLVIEAPISVIRKLFQKLPGNNISKLVTESIKLAQIKERYDVVDYLQQINDKLFLIYDH